MFDLKMLAELQIWHVAGWTMLHYLWLGALAGLLALASKLLLHRATANVRYAVALSFLLLLTVLPAGIAGWLASGSQALPTTVNNTVQQTSTLATEAAELPDRLPIETGVIEQLDAAPIGDAPPQPQIEPMASQPANIFSMANATQYVRFLPWLWIIGTPVTFALLTAGIVGASRLRSVGRPINDARFEQLLSQLKSSLGIGRQVALAICERIASPVLIGIVRPIILLPPAALTGWSPDEIEMVLLHELAHVRRWDNLVNLIQRLVESLLFFHPVVWMVSSWARRERESCCDEFVIARTDRPHAYAELLVALAAEMPRSVLFHPAASSAMSAGPLRSRIRRILQLENDPMLVSGKSLAITFGSLLIVATLAVLYVPNRGQADAPGSETADKKKQQVADDQVKSEDSSLAPPAKTEIRADSITVDLGAVNQPSASSESALTSTSSTATAQAQSTSKFPSLEDQKLADLAWKRLGLEVETIGPEDLVRVIALGYDGGLRVIGRPGTVVRTTADRNGQGILTGDILVGLHVWPTTSLKDVATVLQRDDLNELDPLKFYVVRESPAELSADNPQSTDVVITGRLSINQPRQSSNPNPYFWSATKSSANPAIEPTQQPTQKPNTTEADDWFEPRPVTQQSAPAAAPVADASANPFGPRPATQQSAPVPAPADDAFASPYAVSAPIVADSNSTSPDRRQAAPTAAPSTNTPADPFADRPAKPETYGLAPTPASNAQPSTLGKEDRVVEAYAIPDDLKRDVKQHQRIAQLRGLWDEKGRFILQATRTDHERFKNILDSTPKWLASNRPGQPGSELPRITLRKENDQTILEWIPTGLVLSFEHEPSKRFAGIVVKSVTPGSPAAWQDVRPGDLLTRVEEFRTSSLAELGSIVGSLADGFHDRGKQVSAQFVRIVENEGTTHEAQLLKELPLHFQAPTSQGDSQPPLMQAEPVPPTRDAPAAEPIQPPLTAPIPADPAPVNQPAAPRVPGQPIGPNQATQLPQPVQAPSAAPIPSPDALLAPQGEADAAPMRQAQSPRAASPYADVPSTTSIPGAASSENNRQLPNEELRYDGKTFYEWRNEWKTELSTKKRLDAVHALAAFGRAGFAKQAAEAILEVAAEYDFGVIDNSGDGGLKRAVLDELAPYGRTQSMAPYWLPILTEKLEKAPARWSSLAVELLRRVQTEDNDAVAVLRSLAESAPGRVRPAALVALVRANRLQTGGPQIDDATQALLTASLKGDDPASIRQSIDALYYQPVPGVDLRMVYQPEVIPLLFHADETVRTGARYLLARVQGDDAPKVVESLLEILKDDSRKSDYITAIRALGAIGPNAAAAQPQLEEIFKNEANEMPMRVAAAFANDRVEGGTRLRNAFHDVINKTRDEKAQMRNNQLFNEEQRITNE